MLKLTCAIFLLTVSAIASRTAIAGTIEYSRAYQECVKAAHNSLTVRCATDELQRQQAKLGREVDALMKVLPAARRAKLTNVQRLFEAYREANCKFYGTSLNGPGYYMHDVNGAMCRLHMTADRASELRYFLQVNRG